MENLFVDAQEMHKKHPETFEVPDRERLDRLTAGEWVKVCAAGKERFWVEIQEVEGEKLKGRVDNNLIYYKEHGLRLNDIVEFEKRHIYSTED